MERLPYKMNVNAPSFPPQAGALSHNHAQERLPSCPFPASFYHPSVCCACAPQPPPLKTLRLSRGGMNWQAALAIMTLRKEGCLPPRAPICRSRGFCGKSEGGEAMIVAIFAAERKPAVSRLRRARGSSLNLTTFFRVSSRKKV